MGSHGPRALMEQPTVDTWRQRHQRDGALWAGSVSPDGQFVACVSPFKRGFWLLTINSTSGNRTVAGSSGAPGGGELLASERGTTVDTTATGTPSAPCRQYCVRVRRPEVDREDFLTAKHPLDKRGQGGAR